jgi:hypothetical protein
MTFYKIRHKETGLYCDGSPYASYEFGDSHWKKIGKIWPTLGYLRAYLNKAVFSKNGIPESWEIVECHFTVDTVKTPHEMIDSKVLLKILKK